MCAILEVSGRISSSVAKLVAVRARKYPLHYRVVVAGRVNKEVVGAQSGVAPERMAMALVAGPTKLQRVILLEVPAELFPVDKDVGYEFPLT